MTKSWAEPSSNVASWQTQGRNAYSLLGLFPVIRLSNTIRCRKSKSCELHMQTKLDKLTQCVKKELTIALQTFLLSRIKLLDFLIEVWPITAINYHLCGTQMEDHQSQQLLSDRTQHGWSLRCDTFQTTGRSLAGSMLSCLHTYISHNPQFETPFCRFVFHELDRVTSRLGFLHTLIILKTLLFDVI